jgi:Cysteine rich repeat
MSRFTVAAVCSVALFSVAALVPRAQAQPQGQFAYCKADAARLCQGVHPGGGRMLGCLKAHENDLTVGCAKELKSLKARTGK